MRRYSFIIIIHSGMFAVMGYYVHKCVPVEDDGQRQVSPESPVKPLVHEMPGTKQDASSKQEHEFVDEPSATLPVPPMRPRKNSDASKPKPR